MENSDMQQKFEAWFCEAPELKQICWRAYAEGMREGQQQMRERAVQEIGTSWSIESGGWLDSPKAVMAAIRALD